MFDGGAGLRGGSSHWPVGAVLEHRALRGAMAFVRRVATGGTLAIRVLATGVLLVVGLPLLTVLLYVLGYPATPVPLPIVILVDGLQLIIVAYAVVVGAQLVAYAAAAVARFGRRVPHPAAVALDERTQGEGVPAAPALSSDGWAILRDGSMRLADTIWMHERRGRPEFGPAALAYVRDAVTLELEHRRRAAALQRRAAELEAWTAQDSVVASERM
jgi:hypothetical protein